jgi:putative oxidoreductase
MKILNIILRIVLGLLLISPILGALGVFPPPTPDLYNTPEAFEFINVLMEGKYITYMIAVVFAIAAVAIAMNRMAFAALLILPITVNIISFHLFLDGGLFTAGAIMANVLFLINLYFLWQNRGRYAALWKY